MGRRMLYCATSQSTVGLTIPPRTWLIIDNCGVQTTNEWDRSVIPNSILPICIVMPGTFPVRRLP
jgi:hypothetical protein